MHGSCKLGSAFPRAITILPSQFRRNIHAPPGTFRIDRISLTSVERQDQHISIRRSARIGRGDGRNPVHERTVVQQKSLSRLDQRQIRQMSPIRSAERRRSPGHVAAGDQGHEHEIRSIAVNTFGRWSPRHVQACNDAKLMGLYPPRATPGDESDDVERKPYHFPKNYALDRRRLERREMPPDPTVNAIVFPRLIVRLMGTKPELPAVTHRPEYRVAASPILAPVCHVAISVQPVPGGSKGRPVTGFARTLECSAWARGQ